MFRDVRGPSCSELPMAQSRDRKRWGDVVFTGLGTPEARFREQVSDLLGVAVNLLFQKVPTPRIIIPKAQGAWQP